MVSDVSCVSSDFSQTLDTGNTLPQSIVSAGSLTLFMSRLVSDAAPNCTAFDVMP